jgi:hypothetical protein
MRGTAPRAPAGIFLAGRGQCQTPCAVAESGSARGPPVVRAERCGGRPGAGLCPAGPANLCHSATTWTGSLTGRICSRMNAGRSPCSRMAAMSSVSTSSTAPLLPRFRLRPRCPEGWSAGSSSSGNPGWRHSRARPHRRPGSSRSVPEQEVPSPCSPGTWLVPAAGVFRPTPGTSTCERVPPGGPGRWFTLRRRLAGWGQGASALTPVASGIRSAGQAVGSASWRHLGSRATAGWCKVVELVGASRGGAIAPVAGGGVRLTSFLALLAPLRSGTTCRNCPQRPGDGQSPRTARRMGRRGRPCTSQVRSSSGNAGLTCGYLAPARLVCSSAACCLTGPLCLELSSAQLQATEGHSPSGCLSVRCSVSRGAVG